VGWLLLAVISLLQRIGVPLLLFEMAVMALALAGAAGLCLAFGVVGVNLTWTDPRRMNAGWPGCLAMLLTAGFLVVAMGLFFAPPLVLPALGLPEVVGQAAGLVLGGLASAVCALVPPWLVIKRIAGIGEG